MERNRDMERERERDTYGHMEIYDPNHREGDVKENWKQNR